MTNRTVCRKDVQCEQNVSWDENRKVPMITAAVLGHESIQVRLSSETESWTLRRFLEIQIFRVSM